jgi:hypothetical protein
VLARSSKSAGSCVLRVYNSSPFGGGAKNNRNGDVNLKKKNKQVVSKLTCNQKYILLKNNLQGNDFLFVLSKSGALISFK